MGVFLISFFLRKIKVRIEPINNAISGLPIISIILINCVSKIFKSGYFTVVEIDISIMGIKIGKKEITFRSLLNF